MTTIQDLRDVFSILHDGDISCYSEDGSQLTLKVECRYLAERIDKRFDSFYITLDAIDYLAFIAWPNPFDTPVPQFKSLEDIFKAPLEISSAEVKNGLLLVNCNQHDIKFDYCGGQLLISSEVVYIYDNDGNELSVDSLDSIAKEYWGGIGS
jgi:hypothetical protein